MTLSMLKRNFLIKHLRTVVPNLFLVTDPFQIIIKLMDSYAFMTDPKQIIL